MTNADRRTIAKLGEIVLQLDEDHIASFKLVAARLEALERHVVWLYSLPLLPDDDEKQKLMRQLGEIAAKQVELMTDGRLQSDIARHESFHEEMQALMASVKRSLRDDDSDSDSDAE
jgi:hypothetical protein